MNLARRGFMVSTALAAAGASAAGILVPTAAAAAAPTPKKGYGHGPFPAEGMALHSSQGPHRRMRFQRRALGPKDVAIELRYCGICHSDIHHGREHCVTTREGTRWNR